MGLKRQFPLGFDAPFLLNTIYMIIIACNKMAVFPSFFSSLLYNSCYRHIGKSISDTLGICKVASCIYYSVKGEAAGLLILTHINPSIVYNVHLYMAADTPPAWMMFWVGVSLRPWR